jgi:hypothetical protein
VLDMEGVECPGPPNRTANVGPSHDRKFGDLRLAAKVARRMNAEAHSVRGGTTHGSMR